jgi:hypothetical protein
LADCMHQVTTLTLALAKIGFPQSNESLRVASKQRSTTNRPRPYHLKPLVLMLLLALALPSTAFADSSTALQAGGSKLARASTGSPSSVAAGAQIVDFKPSRSVIRQSSAMATIPEPGTLCLLGTGLLGLAGLMRRRLKAKQALPVALEQPSGD